MSKITKEDYILYDSVVNTILINILVERERCGKFLIYDFTPEVDSEKLYFNITAVAADLRGENIYLNMPFWDYIKFKFKRRKGRKNLRWFGPLEEKNLRDEFKTSVIKIMACVAGQMDIPCELFKQINDAYYGWVK